MMSDDEIFVVPADEFEHLFELTDKANEKFEQWTYMSPVDAFLSGRDVLRAYNQVSQLKPAGGSYLRTIFKGDVYTKVVNGTKYLILKGDPASRTVLKASRYLKSNPKVAMFVVGTEEILEDSRKTSRICVYFAVSIDVMHEVLADKFCLSRMGIKIGIDIMKIYLQSAGAVAGVIVASILGAPAVLTFVIIVAFTTAATIGINYLGSGPINGIPESAVI